MRSDKSIFWTGLYLSLGIVSVLWIIKGLEVAIGLDLRGFGIQPRTLHGSVGIITGPLIHGDFTHLISNSFPLLFAGVAVYYFYQKIAPELLLLSYLGTGILVWLIARDASHIGASGVAYALISFLLFSGIFRKEARTAAVSFVFFFLYGSIFYGMFPGVKPGVSWESHLLGGLVGVGLAYYYKDHDSPKSEKTAGSITYSEEGDYTYTYKEEN